MGLESYELGEEMGVAGPSTLYRGQNAILGSEVMVRRLTIDATRAENVHDTFFREQRLAASLRHPNIQRAIDVFEADGYLWSVHEYREGRLTHDSIGEHGAMQVAEAARLGAQVADALAHMHSQGYVHGKLAPWGIIVDERGVPLIINLVKAADLAAGTWPLRDVVLGLSAFSAPEEFRGEKPTDDSDVYALAGTIFYWLTSHFPRGGATPEEALERAREGAPLEDLTTLRPDVSPVLARRVMRALSEDPSKRQGNAAAFGALLQEIHQRQAAEIPSGFQTGAQLHPAGCAREVTILGRHGVGAFGVVLRAQDPVCGSDLAVKALKPEHRDDHNAHERFLREARAMQQIDHQNVVGIKGVGEENGTPYAVMNFINGPDLGTLLLREGALPADRAAHIGAGIARGLAAIHAEGIVHRDLKPHNILVAEGDRPVIADFGIARQDKTTRLTMTGQLAGTPLYMAPEQFEGDDPTPAVDLYALGTILYELMTGNVPFPDGDTLSTITAIRTKPHPKLPEDVPTLLRSVTDQLLAKDPAERPTDALEVADVLEGLAATTP